MQAIARKISRLFEYKDQESHVPAKILRKTKRSVYLLSQIIVLLKPKQ